MKKKQAEQQTLFGRFTDAVIYSSDTKKAVSVRDGVLEYMGAELGIEPLDKTFKVYRSPATIANAANQMDNIPLTDEHVEVGINVTDSAGKVINAVMIDLVDNATSSTLAIQNSIDVSDEALSVLSSGKRELSLGYSAELIESDNPDYDFIQQNIVPHHLAIVDRGRCGASCSFIDNKPLTQQEPQMAKKKLLVAAISAAFEDKKAGEAIAANFVDMEGALRIDELVQFISSLPETLKNSDVATVQKLMSVMKSTTQELGEEVGENVADMESEAMDMASENMDMAPGETHDKMKVTDTKAFGDALKKMTDTAVKAHTVVIQKAQDLLPDTYDYADKSADQIMRACLATQYGSQKFGDSELSTAFKMLRPVQKLEVNLSDKKENGFNSLSDQEI